MQRKRRDNRTRMQRKADQSAAIAAFCLFFCAVLAFCAGVCKITTPKLKPQERALKCEIEVCEESKVEDRDGSLPGDDTPATLCAYIEYEIPAYNLSDADRETLWHIVQGEAGGESYEGKLWVATCLLNAMRKNDMSAEEVRVAYQYSGWAETVSEDTKKAVSQVFDFGDTTHDSVLWFYAPKWCDSEWHESQNFVAEIGGHRFFSPWEE